MEVSGCLAAQPVIQGFIRCLKGFFQGQRYRCLHWVTNSLHCQATVTDISYHRQTLRCIGLESTIMTQLHGERSTCGASVIYVIIPPCPPIAAPHPHPDDDEEDEDV